jgi:serine/threonine protein kinase
MASRTVTKQDWTQWRGQLVAGKFPLTELLGSSDHSGVFLTERSSGQKAALKLIPLGTSNADVYLNRWKAVSWLLHPHLLKIFEFGKCELGRQFFAFVVMELAEENLAQVVPHRGLTAEEAKPALAATVDALAYLHSKDFVHGRIRPTNIMASGEQLKIAVDGICEANKSCPAASADVYCAPEYGANMSSAADVWSLGMTLVEVLTQRLPVVSAGSEPHVPPTLPQPFFDIARHALRRDPQQRWTLSQIQQSLTPGSVKPQRAEAEPLRKRPRYLIPVLAIAGLVVLLVAFAFLYRQQSPAPVSSSPVSPKSSAAGESGPTTEIAPPAQPKPRAGGGGSHPATRETSSSEPSAGVRERVMPAVAPSSIRTITGHFRIVIQASVDDAGNVTDAKFKTRGPSQYFARLSMEAARKWKFAPAEVNGRPAASAVPSQWMITFKFSRAGIDGSAEQVSP